MKNKSFKQPHENLSRNSRWPDVEESFRNWWNWPETTICDHLAILRKIQ